MTTRETYWHLAADAVVAEPGDGPWYVAVVIRPDGIETHVCSGWEDLEEFRKTVGGGNTQVRAIVIASRTREVV